MYYSLSKREIDILITVQKPTHGKIVARRLTRYRLGLFSTRQYIDLGEEITSKKQLREHRFVGYIDDLLFDQDLDLMGEILPGLTADFRCSTVVAQLSAVVSGAGIGIIPFFMAAREKSLIQVLPDHYIEKAYWLQVNPDSRQLARVRTTIDFIAEQITLSQEQFLTFAPG
jgi:DNA-binding transcriptional LysR family regulator